MHWLIVASILAVEGCLVVVVLQLLARWLWVWIRWPLWIVLVVASSLTAAATFDVVGDNLRHTILGGWHSEQDLLGFQAPYPTYRLFLLSSISAVPVLFVILGIASLLRWKSGGFQLLVWRASWRSSVVALGIASGVSLLVVTANDLWICTRIRAVDKESRLLAASSAPPICSNEENAASIYKEIGPLSDQLKENGLPDATDNVELLRSEHWSDYLSRNADLARRVREGSTRSRCRFEIDWSDPDPIAEHPELHDIGASIRLLYSQGRRALLDGDVKLGLDNAVALRRIAEQLNEDPRRLAQLLANTAEGLAGDAIEHLIYVHRPTPEEVTQLIRPGFEFRQSLNSATIRQQAEYYRMLAMAYFGLVVDPDDRKIPGFSLMHAAVLTRNRLFYANDDLRALPLIFAEVKRRCAVPYGQPLEGNNNALWFYAYRCGGATIAKSMDPVVYSSITYHVRADMRRRLVDFALVLAEDGVVEEILAKGPDVAVPIANRPTDIFDDKPIRIVIADGGVVVYSIDVYGEDDGGSEGVPASVSGKGYLRDMTFCFGQAYKVRRLTPRKKDEEQSRSVNATDDVPPSTDPNNP
jgi:hypothetical protein